MWLAHPLLSRALKFYRQHLSRYLVFRVLRVFATMFFRFVYRAYCHLKPTASVGRYGLVPFGSYMGGHLVARVPIFAAHLTHIRGPDFMNDRNSAISATPHTVAIELPKVDVLELNDVAVVGGTDFILAGEVALAPDCLVECADTCPAETFGVAWIDHSQGSLQLFLSGEGIRIETGISLLGQNTANYAHWLTETLPKLAVLNAYPQYKDLPLLVDCGLHRNIYDSIGTVGGKQRQLIFVEQWQRVHLKRLVGVSQAGYEPYIPHGLFNTGIPQIVNTFSAPALMVLRDAVLDKLPSPNPLSGVKIFFRRSDRSNNLRGLTNSSDVEALLQKMGYTLIDPAEMSFVEQVSVCHAARIIVAPIGAALANMIFARPGCRLLALSPYYKNANYYYYSNLAAALKIPFSYLLGRQGDEHGHPMHRSYSIKLDELERALGSLTDR